MAYAVSDLITLDKPILSDLDTVSTTDNGETGKIVTSSDGRKYKKVVVDVSTVAASAGYPAWHMVGSTANEVTGDYSDSNAGAEVDGATFAGVFCGAITAATVQYAWIELPNGSLTEDASVSTNVGICDALSAVNDYFFNICASDEKPVAIAMAAASSNLADIIML